MNALGQTGGSAVVSVHSGEDGAGGRDRTGTGLVSPRDFKSLASANSATPAKQTGEKGSQPRSRIAFTLGRTERVRLACPLAAALLRNFLGQSVQANKSGETLTSG